MCRCSRAGHLTVPPTMPSDTTAHLPRDAGATCCPRRAWASQLPEHTPFLLTSPVSCVLLQKLKVTTLPCSNSPEAFCSVVSGGGCQIGDLFHRCRKWS